MRILTNYMLKQGRENYGSEAFTVTVEAELDMGIERVGESVDALFAEARAAVARQINDVAGETKPAMDIPKAEAPEKPKDADAAKGKTPATTKQVSMILKLIEEVFDNETEGFAWLKQKGGTARVKDLSRRTASKIIEQLIDRQRSVA